MTLSGRGSAVYDASVLASHLREHRKTKDKMSEVGYEGYKLLPLA
jgi:hypothetical protein